MRALLPILAATGPEETTLRFKALPPLWLLFMVIFPVILGFVWWIYMREGATATPRVKRVLAAIRTITIVFVLLLFFQPYAETSVRRLVKSHLVVAVDTSASMEFRDSYSDAAKAAALKDAADLAAESPSQVSRLALVKGVLGNDRLRLLDRLAEDFNLHLYTLDSSAQLLSSSGEAWEDEQGRAALAGRIAGLRGTGSATFLGDSLSALLDEFRLRDEPLAGIVLLTDGRQTGGTTSALDAARRAARLTPRVPIYPVAAGDPDLPKNIHAANLRAKEVVLRGDDVSFEFDLSHKGFAGEPVAVRLLSREKDSGEEPRELDLRGADLVLGEEDEEQPVRVSHRFDRPGSYTLRIGVPVQPGEKIEEDNFLVHHLQVVDKKIKVLYVDGYPRWEYRYLKNGLIRDTESVLAHVINLDADPEGVVQPFSPGWTPRQRFPVKKEELFEYDVVIFGDVDWHKLGRSDAEAREALENLREFVREGGGFIMIAGPDSAPGSYRSTDLRHVLPIVMSVEEEGRAVYDSTRSFNLRLTEEGARHPIMQLEDDPEVVRQIWEKDRFSAQFWYYPAERAKPTATVLARHPGEYSHNRNKYGPHVLVATMRYGSGRSLFIGVDELWRLRWSFGDRYHYRFYGEAIRLLATYRLLGRNLRFKIFTDQNTYYVGDTVEISAEVFDQDFEPSREETQTLTVRSPDGEERQAVLTLDPADPGRYSTRLTVYQEGTYILTAETPQGEEERPEKLFMVEYSTEEMKNPLIDQPTMEQIAAESGGELLSLDRVGELVGKIPPRSVYVSSEVRSTDLWDEPWVLFLVVALLAAEWLVRKRFRLT